MNKPFKYEATNIEWSYNMTHFTAWCEGKTGFPIGTSTSPLSPPLNHAELNPFQSTPPCASSTTPATCTTGAA